MKYLIFLSIVIVAMSCSFGKKMVERESLYKTKKYIGVYDTCYFHSGGFMVAPTVLIQMKDTTFVCVYGKKCEFEHGEWLYRKYEYWNGQNKWKKFVVNLNEEYKYAITIR